MAIAQTGLVVAAVNPLGRHNFDAREFVLVQPLTIAQIPKCFRYRAAGANLELVRFFDRRIVLQPIPIQRQKSRFLLLAVIIIALTLEEQKGADGISHPGLLNTVEQAAVVCREIQGTRVVPRKISDQLAG